MVYEITNVTLLQVDANGQTSVLSTNTTTIPINVTTVKDTIVITQSQKDYNYITLGKNSNIQLPLYTDIIVKSGNNVVKTRTHKTQKNRFDRMKQILSGYSVGSCVTVEWDQANNTITIS